MPAPTWASRSSPRLTAAAGGGRCGRPSMATAVTVASAQVAIHLHPHQGQDAVQLIAVVVAWLLGDMVRSLRGYRQQVQLLQLSRAAEEVRLARAEERVRLSREVHDVVSHSLSTIAVQAGVARLVLAKQPGQAGTALSAIETASRSALDELRKLLRQIRDPEDADEVGDAHHRRPAGAHRPAAHGRPGRDLPHDRAAAPVRHRRRVLRVPDRAGGADQRDQACRRRAHHGRGRPRRRRAHDHGVRRRPPRPAGALRRRRCRARHPRDAGTSRAAWRNPGRRAGTGRRIRGHRASASRPGEVQQRGGQRQDGRAR